MSKTILITGASDGIGREIAIRLSEDDHKLILCGRNQERLQKTADDCVGETTTLAFDINNSAQRQAELSKVKSLDVIINNAGIWHKVGDLTSLSDEDVTSVINTNLTSQVLITKQLLPLVRGKKGAAIINVISKSGVTAQEGQTAYTASKYGMRGFTDVLREDTKGDEVRVAAVYQSGTNTDMFEKAGEDFPVETFTEPEDLAEVVAFMLSRPDKLWINEIRLEK